MGRVTDLDHVLGGLEARVGGFGRPERGVGRAGGGTAGRQLKAEVGDVGGVGQQGERQKGGRAQKGEDCGV